jgi:hypothetical protein
MKQINKSTQISMDKMTEVINKLSQLNSFADLTMEIIEEMSIAVEHQLGFVEVSKGRKYVEEMKFFYNNYQLIKN